MAAKPFLYAQFLGAVTPNPRRFAQAFAEGAGAVRRALRAGARRTRDVTEEIRRRAVSAPRSYSYLALGLLLALGAPVGLLLARALSSSDEVVVTYLYVTYSTMAAFALFGYLLGRAADEGRRQAITDPLTGLFTRRHFAERLTDEAKRARRHAHTLSVLYLDVDHLKAINDKFGHEAGDGALLAVRRTLRDSARAGDIVARVGGDEFAVLLPETSAAQASALSRRILAEVAWQGDLLPSGLSISIGIAELGKAAAREPDDLLAAARDALHGAKPASGASAAALPQRPGWPPAWGTQTAQRVGG